MPKAVPYWVASSAQELAQSSATSQVMRPKVPYWEVPSAQELAHFWETKRTNKILNNNKVIKTQTGKITGIKASFFII
jgi:ubiquinone biosynthesis protein COQ9